MRQNELADIFIIQMYELYFLKVSKVMFSSLKGNSVFIIWNRMDFVHCLAGMPEDFWTTDNWMRGYSLWDHQNMKRNILKESEWN
jgi:hypothetical protein